MGAATVTISGGGSSLTGNPFAALSQNTTLSLDDYVSTINPHVKKYQVCEIEEDLLVLSATWFRLRQEQANGGLYFGIEKLTDTKLFSKITEDDRKLASDIRDYFSKKIMMWKLKGQRLSKFREDMSTFIHSDGKVFKEDMCPLVYRLPEFHAYDVEFDSMAMEHSKVIPTRVAGKVSKQITLRKTFIVGKRYAKRKEYWFTDEDDKLVTLSVVKDNPLVPLLDLHAQKPFVLNAKFDTRERDNVQYMVAEKYTFE